MAHDCSPLAEESPPHKDAVLANRCKNVLQFLGGTFYRLRATFDLDRALFDQFLDVGRGLSSRLRQPADFHGNHGKAFACFTGPSSLDRGIEAYKLVWNAMFVD